MSRPWMRVCQVWIAAGTLAACVPLEQPSDLTVIDRPRVLGVVADPPEVAPGAPVTLRLVVASPQGTLSKGRAKWTFCRVPKALSEPGFASESCLYGEDPPLPERALTLRAILPDDACDLFAGATDVDLRPRDPDPTGGYYQPVRVAVFDGELALGRVRISCPLQDAPLAVVQAYAARHQPNRAPGIASILADGDELPGDDAETGLPADTGLELSVRLTQGSRERYWLYERAGAQLTQKTEELAATWFVTGGELALQQTSVEMEDPRTAGGHERVEVARVAWHTPKRPGRAHLWVLVRDDRGGLVYGARTVRIEAKH